MVCIYVYMCRTLINFVLPCMAVCGVYICIYVPYFNKLCIAVHGRVWCVYVYIWRTLINFVLPCMAVCGVYICIYVAYSNKLCIAVHGRVWCVYMEICAVL